MQNIQKYCSQPGYRADLLQLAATHLKNIKDPTKLSNQELCQLLKNSDIDQYPKSSFNIGVILIPMTDNNNNYYDFIDAIAVADMYPNSVTKTQTGIQVTGSHAVKALNTYLRQDSLNLNWFIDAKTTAGQNRANEWGHLYNKNDWKEGLDLLKDYINHPMYIWSRYHKPMNLNIRKAQQTQTQPQTTFTQQTDQSQNSQWPPTLQDGSIILPVQLQQARDILANFQPAQNYLDAAQPIPLKILHDFMTDERFLSMQSQGQSEDSLVNQIVIVYMWDMNKSITFTNQLNLTESHVKEMVRSANFDTLLSDYFMSGGRFDTWFKYVGSRLSQREYSYSEEEQLIDVSHNGYAIRQIIDNGIVPSERVQLAAVSQNGHALEYIQDPSEEVQLAAVSNSGGFVIHYILDKDIIPSEKVQLATVSQDGDAIRFFFENDIPSEKVQLAAVSNAGSAIKYIFENDIIPSEEMQLAAVSQNGHAIKYIFENDITPSRKVQLAAVSTDPYAIKHIFKNEIIPSEEVQLAAVSQDGHAIKYILKKDIVPSEDMQLYAVSNDPYAIKHILNKGIVPSEDVQLAAVSKFGSMIKYILDKGIQPSEQVRLAAQQQNEYMLRMYPEQQQLRDVQQNGRAIRFIFEKGIIPSEQVQRAAVSENGYAIRHILDKDIVPSEEVQRAAVSGYGYGYVIKYILDKRITPSEEVQLTAVSEDGVTIMKILEKGIVPSERVQRTAVSQNGYVIKHILEKGIVPSERVQRTAVSQDPKAIEYIRNPSPEVIQAAHNAQNQ